MDGVIYIRLSFGLLKKNTSLLYKEASDALADGTVRMKELGGPRA
jgi:hypothetical protein